MQTIELWNMQHLLRSKIIFLCVAFCTSCIVTNAQFGEINLPDHDDHKYYFGITLAGNSSNFRLLHHPLFLQNDSLFVAEPRNTGGFGLGLLATLNVTKRFQLRFNPILQFASRVVRYNLKYPLPGETNVVDKKIESVITSFPIQVKFLSDRIHNFRFYLLGGLKYDIDLASNSTARRAEDLLKIKRSDYGYEAGIGFNFYFEKFIFSPEIKISNGLGDIHVRDNNLIFSNRLETLHSRMIIFSIHLEG